jgi:hypothetical protein
MREAVAQSSLGFTTSTGVSSGSHGGTPTRLQQRVLEPDPSGYSTRKRDFIRTTT